MPPNFPLTVPSFLLLAEFPELLKRELRLVRVLCYADDVVLYGKLRTTVQVALGIHENFCKDRGLCLNGEKTVAVKFRKGERVKRGDRFRVDRKLVRMKNEVKYLGVKLRSCRSVEGHLRDRIRGAKISRNSESYNASRCRLV